MKQQWFRTETLREECKVLYFRLKKFRSFKRVTMEQKLKIKLGMCLLNELYMIVPREGITGRQYQDIEAQRELLRELGEL